MDREVKFISIPIDLWENKNLSWDEKVLLFEIDSFTKKGKDCYMSDEYIANFLHCSESTAKRTLKSLIERGYVRITRKEGKIRYIQSLLVFGVEGQNEPQESTMGVNLTENGGQNEPQPIINDLLFPPIVSDNKLSSTIDPKVGNTPKKFVKPSSDDVREFCLENNFLFLDPDEFVDFYESKGWRVGNAPMKDWKAAARRWSRQNSQRYGAKPILQPQTKEYPDGTYWKKDFSDEEIKKLFGFDLTLRKQLSRGYSIKRKNGQWVI